MRAARALFDSAAAEREALDGNRDKDSAKNVGRGELVTDRRRSLGYVANEIVGMYRSLGGDNVIDDIMRSPNLLGRRLTFLSALGKGDIGPDDLSDVDGLLLQESFLDATAMQLAAGGRDGVVATFGAKDPSLLGKLGLRRAKFAESDEEQMNWHFQTLVQAWAAAHSSKPIKELESDPRLKGRKSCDFLGGHLKSGH